MALVRVNLGINAQYKFTYGGPAEIIDKKADQAARFLHQSGYGDQAKTYAELDVTERLAILDQYVLKVLVDSSRLYAMGVARSSAEASVQAAIDAAEQIEESEVVTA